MASSPKRGVYKDASDSGAHAHRHRRLFAFMSDTFSRRWGACVGSRCVEYASCSATGEVSILTALISVRRRKNYLLYDIKFTSEERWLTWQNLLLYYFYTYIVHLLNIHLNKMFMGFIWGDFTVEGMASIHQLFKWSFFFSVCLTISDTSDNSKQSIFIYLDTCLEGIFKYNHIAGYKIGMDMINNNCNLGNKMHLCCLLFLLSLQQTSILSILTFCIELRHLNLGSCVRVRMHTHTRTNMHTHTHAQHTSTQEKVQIKHSLLTTQTSMWPWSLLQSSLSKRWHQHQLCCNILSC